jgi:hypothetical protein
MSVDFTAILDHRLSWEEICRLPATLNSRWRTADLAAFSAEIPNAGKVWRWRISPTFSSPAEELFDEGCVHLEGPSVFGAWVFRHALEVTSCARWWSFLYQKDVRAGLLAGVRQLAGLLGSSTIVYLPDSAYPPSVASDRLHEGGEIAEVINWLQTKVGAPASSIDAIRGADEDEWDESGYVIERVEASAFPPSIPGTT